MSVDFFELLFERRKDHYKDYSQFNASNKCMGYLDFMCSSIYFTYSDRMYQSLKEMKEQGFISYLNIQPTRPNKFIEFRLDRTIVEARFTVETL